MIARHVSEVELIAYAEGEQSGAEQERLERHLRHCRACAGALDQVRDASRLVTALRPLPPPADLGQRIAAKLAIEPVRALRCREARGMLQESLDGVLAPFAAGALQLHLDGCQACRGELATLSHTTHAVRALSPAPSPAGLWESVAARSRRPVQVPWGVRLRPAMAGMAAAAAGVLFFLMRPAPQLMVQQPQPTRSALVQPSAGTQPVPPAATAVAPNEVQPAPAAATAPANANQPVEVALAPEPIHRVVRTHAIAPSVRSSYRATTADFTVPPQPEVMNPVAVATAPDPAPRSASLSPVAPSGMAPRVLTAVARVATYDGAPYDSMASAGERLGVMASEDLAQGPPQLPRGGAGGPGRGRESGAADGCARVWVSTEDITRGTA